MLSGLPPFHEPDISPVVLYEKIAQGPACIKWPAFHPNATDLILKFMERDPSKRFGNMQHGAGDVFAHPWFAEVDWNKLVKREITAPYLPKITSDGDASACVSFLCCCLLSKDAWTLIGQADAGCLGSSDTPRIARRCGMASRRRIHMGTGSRTLNTRLHDSLRLGSCVSYPALSSHHSPFRHSSLLSVSLVYTTNAINAVSPGTTCTASVTCIPQSPSPSRTHMNTSTYTYTRATPLLYCIQHPHMTPQSWTLFSTLYSLFSGCCCTVYAYVRSYPCLCPSSCCRLLSCVSLSMPSPFDGLAIVAHQACPYVSRPSLYVLQSHVYAYKSLPRLPCLPRRVPRAQECVGSGDSDELAATATDNLRSGSM